MAINKKDAGRVAQVLADELGSHDNLRDALARLKKLDIKNKSFRKSLKRISKAIDKSEQPKGRKLKAA